MRKLICCCILFIFLKSFSQAIDLNNPETRTPAINNLFTESGTPFIEAKFVRLVSGSPFFNEKMMRGILVSKDSIQYSNLGLRLNLMESQVNFLNEKEMVVGVPIRELILPDTVNHKNFHFIYSDHIATTDKLEKGFYQILQKGEAGLYVYYRKTVKETRQFNAATFEQSIETYLTYFVLIGGQWTKINSIKNLPSILSDKKSEV